MSELNYKTISDNTVEVSWNKCDFDKAFDTYQISLQTTDGTVKEDISDVNQTKKVYKNFPVGEKGTFNFYVKPRTTPEGHSIVKGKNTFYKTVFIGDEWFGFNQMVAADDRYYYFQASSWNNLNRVYLYDNRSGKIIDSVDVNNYYDNAISKSPNGKHILVKDKLNIMLVNAGELNDGDVFTAFEITGRTEGFDFTNFSIADNLIGGFNLWGYLYVYDLKNRKLLDTIQAKSNNIFQQISFDGRHIVLFDNNELNLYRYDNVKLANIRKLKSNSTAFFIPGTNELICYDANDLVYKILDCNTNTFIRTLAIDKPILYCDFINDRALIRDGKILRIINLLGDNREIKALSVNIANYNTVINGDYIFFPTGIKMRFAN